MISRVLFWCKSNVNKFLVSECTCETFNPCKNGGTCSCVGDVLDIPVCECADGYTGMFCTEGSYFNFCITMYNQRICILI